VIFTSFHNEKQNTSKELDLLRYIVFAAVTSQVESRQVTTMKEQGFTPRKHGLISVSRNNPKAVQNYKAPNPGKLQFALGFNNVGARLRLTLDSPDGKRAIHEGHSAFTLEVSDAVVGDWRYTVEALEIPSPNFPFTVTVGSAPGS